MVADDRGGRRQLGIVVAIAPSKAGGRQFIKAREEPGASRFILGVLIFCDGKIVSSGGKGSYRSSEVERRGSHDE